MVRLTCIEFDKFLFDFINQWICDIPETFQITIQWNWISGTHFCLEEILSLSHFHFESIQFLLHTTFASHRPRNCFNFPRNNKFTSPITALISVRAKTLRIVSFLSLSLTYHPDFTIFSQSIIFRLKDSIKNFGFFTKKFFFRIQFGQKCLTILNTENSNETNNFLDGIFIEKQANPPFIAYHHVNTKDSMMIVMRKCEHEEKERRRRRRKKDV